MKLLSRVLVIDAPPGGMKTGKLAREATEIIPPSTAGPRLPIRPDAS